MKTKGLYTALVTPLNLDGSLDLAGLTENIEFQIAAGVDGIIPLGTTGESPTMDDSEKIAVIKASIKIAKGKIPVMVGATSNSTAVTIANCKIAKELGADSVLIATPYYNKPTQDGIYQHFKAITSAIDLPIMVYNVPGRSGVNIETATVKKIVTTLPNITSIKEASGNINQIGDVINQIQNTTSNFSVMSGDDALTLPLMALGGLGIVSVVSNLVPKQIKQMVDLALTGDFSAASKLHFQLLPLFQTAFIESNPIPIKAMMDLAKMKAGPCRLPLTQLTPASQEIIQNTLRNSGII